MKQPSCTRLWQAEAIEDGRLAGADLSSFQRHAETCADCGREVKELSQLRRALTKLPTPASSPLERRRLRAEVLQRADAARLGGASPASRRFFVAALVAATLLVVVAVISRWRTPEQPALAKTPTFQIEPSAGAELQLEEQGSTVRQRLVRGRVAFHVDKLEAGQRFIVRLPDGELEVKGTRFVVEVGPSGTERVTCSEGRVALRFAGRDDLLLSAGDAWPAREVSPVVAVSATPETAPSALPPARKAAPSAAPSPGADFVEAMGAFSEGDLGRAEKLFASFEQRHPNDARVEDAAFLRAVARARRGDEEGARVLARDYLRRYPTGLRKIEAEQLAR